MKMNKNLWSKYDPKITIKKGFWMAIVTAMISIMVQALQSGEVSIGNTSIYAAILGIFKVLENYLKNKDKQ